MNLNDKRIYVFILVIACGSIVLWILYQREFIDLLSKVATIVTAAGVVIAYCEYKSKTANKVNERQLDQVIELINFLNNKKCICLIPKSGKADDMNISHLDYGLISGLEEIYFNQNKYHAIGIYNYIEQTNAELIEKYSKDPLIPKNVSEKIKKYCYSYKLLPSRVKYEEDWEILKISRAKELSDYVSGYINDKDISKMSGEHYKKDYQTLSNLLMIGCMIIK